MGGGGLRICGDPTCDDLLLCYSRDGEPFQRRVPILRPLESHNVWHAKTKSEEYWAILIAYNITFLYRIFAILSLTWGSNQKCPLESDRSINGATQVAIGDVGGLNSFNGVWAEPQ